MAKRILVEERLKGSPIDNGKLPANILFLIFNLADEADIPTYQAIKQIISTALPEPVFGLDPAVSYNQMPSNLGAVLAAHILERYVEPSQFFNDIFAEVCKKNLISRDWFK